jgi:YVTN family beta-propeller protein
MVPRVTASGGPLSRLGLAASSFSLGFLLFASSCVESDAQSEIEALANSGQALTPSSWVAVTQPPDLVLNQLSIPSTAPTQGAWSPTYAWPLNAIHMTLLPNGSVLSYGSNRDGGQQDGRYFDVWSPAAGMGTNSHNTTFDSGKLNSFCGSSAFATDGRLLLTGGNDAASSQYYDPATNQRVVANMKLAQNRWYSTMLTLPDGRPLILGGMVPYTEGMTSDPTGAIAQGLPSMTPEILENGSWRSLFGAYSRDAFGPDFLRCSYPRAFVAPDGRVFGVSADKMWYLDPSNNGAITTVGNFKQGYSAKQPVNVGATNTAVMYAPGKILIAGGNGSFNGDGLPASNLVTAIDINGGGAVLTEQPAMTYPRRYPNAVVLADGTVVITGGTRVGNNNGADAVYPVELWRPDTGKWTVGASAAQFRGYHSFTTLLPNGAILSAGGGTPGPVVNLNAELYYPPSFFRTVNGVAQLAQRPVIAALSGLSYANGQTIQVDMASSATIRQLVLLGATTGTHSFNVGQRRIPLTFAQNSIRLTATIPTNLLTPPGYYQLVAVDANGGISSGILVAIGQGITPPTIPTTPYEPPTIDAALAAPVIPPGTAATYTLSATAGVSYSWDFGDGTVTPPSASASITHVFAKPGVYTVTVTVQGANGTSRRTFLQAVSTSAVAGKPVSSSSMVVQGRAPAADWLWVVNPDNNSVSAIDLGSNSRVSEVGVGRSPRSLALAPNGQLWVTNKADSTISVVDPATLTVVRTIALPLASAPHGLVFAPKGAGAYVALEATGTVAKLDASTGAVTGTVALAAGARHLALSADGSMLLASRFITAPLAGESTANVDTVNGGGEVLLVDTGTLTVSRRVVLQQSTKTDTPTQGRGVPNYLAAPAISPDGTSAWVPSKQDNVARGILRNLLPLDFQNTVRAITSRINLATQSEDYALRVDHDNAGLATAAAFHPSGVYLFVALETSRQVALLDALRGSELLRIDVGRAPQGLTFSADGMTLYVSNFMDRTVSVLDLKPLLTKGLLQASVVASVSTVGRDALPANVLLGKQLFYDARDPRLARDAYLSCATCHADGGQDGRVWDLTGFGEGLRNTIALNGRAGMGHGALHWSGNFDEVQDFEGQIRALAGGTGLMADSVLAVGTRNKPYGDAKAGLSPDLDALAAYVGSLVQFAPSPYRPGAGAQTNAAALGEAVFQRAACASCHGGLPFTFSRLDGGMRSVGTIKSPSSGYRLGAPLTGLDIPTLRDVWSTAPYLHDGSAPTLDVAIRAHAGSANLAAADVTNLVSYLQQRDGNDRSPLAALPNGVYRLTAVHSNQAVDVAGVSTANGAQASQWPWWGGDNQRWKLTALGNGKYTFAAQHSGQMLEVANCSTSDGARVQQWPANGAACQAWLIAEVGDGTFNLINSNSGKALDVSNASLANGAALVQWTRHGGANQRWKIEPVSANNVAAGTYRVTPTSASGSALDVPGVSTQPGVGLQQWSYWGGGNQKWIVSPTPDGYFDLTSTLAPTLRLEVERGNLALGAGVQQGVRSGAAAQRWGFEAVGNGSYRVTNVNSGRVLDVVNCSNADGARVQQWDWLGTPCQKWTLSATN